MTKPTRPHQWIQTLSSARAPEGLAGHELAFDARQLFHGVPADVAWNIGDAEGRGAEIRWTPRQPGEHVLRLRGTRFSARASIRIGLRLTDLSRRRDALDYYFCLVVRQRAKLHFIPLLASARETKARAGGVDRKKLTAEVSGGHRAFARFLRNHSHLYHARLRRGPFPDVNRARQGLYAVFRDDAVYLGESTALRAVIDEVPGLLTKARRTAIGRGESMAALVSLVRTVDPATWTFHDRTLHPVSNPRRPAFSLGRFTSRILTPLVAEADALARDLGAEDGLGSVSSLFTFNGANGALTSRVFDPTAGFSRQVTSAFDVLGEAGKGTRGLFDFTIDVFGRGSSDAAPGTGLGGLVGAAGAGPLGTRAGQSAMDGEGGDSGGSFSVTDEEGNDLLYTSGSYNNPGEDASTETSDDGTTIWYADETHIDFTNGGGDGGDGGGGGAGEGEGEGDDGDGDQPDGGEDGDGGDGDGDGDGGDGNGDEGGGEGEGEGEGEGGETPGGADPESSEANGEGGAGQPAGDEGGGGRPVGGGSLATLTRGGGYTDPSPDDGGGGGGGGDAGGPNVVQPGGGVTDPPKDGATHGFARWGGYNPPIGCERDPYVNPGDGYAQTEGEPLRRTVSFQGQVRVEELGGPTADGAPADGLVSAGMVQDVDGDELTLD